MTGLGIVLVLWMFARPVAGDDMMACSVTEREAVCKILEDTSEYYYPEAEFREIFYVFEVRGRVWAPTTWRFVDIYSYPRPPLYTPVNPLYLQGHPHRWGYCPYPIYSRE